MSSLLRNWGHRAPHFTPLLDVVSREPEASNCGALPILTTIFVSLLLILGRDVREWSYLNT